MATTTTINTTAASTKPMLFPLGENLYASVKTWRGSVKIHGRHYAVPTSTKGGKVKPTQKGVAMSLKQCERLFRVKRKLFELYHEQASSLAGKVVINPTAPSKQVRRKTCLTEIRQKQVPFIMTELTARAATQAVMPTTQKATRHASTQCPRPPLCFYSPHQDSLFHKSQL